MPLCTCDLPFQGQILRFGKYVCVCVLSCVASLQPHGLYPTRLLCPWDFPGKKTGVGCHFLLYWEIVVPKIHITQLKH